MDVFWNQNSILTSVVILKPLCSNILLLTTRSITFLATDLMRNSQELLWFLVLTTSSIVLDLTQPP